MIRRFLKDETGATAVEYAVVVGVLSLAIVASIGQVYDAIVYLFSDNSSRLVQAIK
ncbi:Flp family type IVb pilin [Rhizobiaceae sp. 2RAB30]